MRNTLSSSTQNFINMSTLRFHALKESLGTRTPLIIKETIKTLCNFWENVFNDVNNEAILN